jgi:HK97 family phage major capsid protein
MTPSSVLIPDSNGRRQPLSVRSESLTYTPHTEHRYFVDLLGADRGKSDAAERLERHEREMRAELPQIERRGSSTHPEGTTFEYRTPSGAQGAGGYATPPAWLVELEGVYERPERVISDLAGSYRLPKGVGSVNIPILTTGTSTRVQVPTTAVSATDVTDAAGTSPVVTIIGQEDIPLQMFEQSPKGAWEQVLFRDLQADFDWKLEAQLINGIGGSGITAQILGLTNVTGINSITYADSTPTGSELFPNLGTAFGSVSDNRKVRPQGWLMRGGRYSWLATSEDASSRPLEVPLSAQPLTEDVNKPTPIGSLVGLPVFTNEALPTNLGTGANQDQIIAFRWSDFYVWESDPVMHVFTQTLSGELMARVQYRKFAAAILNRYPTGIATISGTGMVVPTNE